MADNVDITPGAGATVATDQVGSGRHYQRMKLTDGAEGSENHASVRADGTQEVTLSDINAALYAILEAITRPIGQESDPAAPCTAAHSESPGSIRRTPGSLSQSPPSAQRVRRSPETETPPRLLPAARSQPRRSRSNRSGSNAPSPSAVGVDVSLPPAR